MKDSFTPPLHKAFEIADKETDCKWRQHLDLEVWILHITGLFLLVIAYFLFVIP